MAKTIQTQSLLQSPANNPWSITLQVTEGLHAGQIFSFAQHDTFVVGRSKEAHFCLPDKDPFFSRLHFLIEVNPPMCKLVDLKSHNGTSVNGQRVSSIDLKDGDEIRCGTTILLVCIRSAAVAEFPATTPPPTGRPAPAATVQPHELPAIPGYRMGQELGRGGMGVVYQAQRESDRRDVALKTIIPRVRSHQDTMDRFLREANILSQLRHPHIVAFQDMGQTGDLIYFAMDLVVGTDAYKLVGSQGPLPVGQATRLFLQVLDALAYAHQKGFVHRDLKPGNILVVQDPGHDLAKVADFGLARTYQEYPMSGLTMSGQTYGTPQYMPPEQVMHFRSVKPAGDQYAAAATLYFLLTGQPPYDSTENAQDFLKRILQEEPVRIDKRRADIPKELADIIHRALDREPSYRFPDVLALGQALEAFSRLS